MKVETERFTIKPLTQADATERYLGWLIKEAQEEFILSARTFQTIESIRQYINKFESSSIAKIFGIFITTNQEHIGNIKYDSISLTDRSAVMGIMIGEEEWKGKGVAKEVIVGTAKLLRDQLRIESIILGVKTKNKAAIKAYEKIGFKKISAPLFENNGEAQKMVLKTDQLI